MTSVGFRQTVAQRRARQRTAEMNHSSKFKNRGPGWKSDALDLYLAGVSIPEICEHYEVKNGSAALYQAMATEALLGLMEAHHCDRLDEVEELTRGLP